ncbi:MAG: 4-phosphopantetheinyl transferase superfamily protein [Candidatus Sulfotelmatobacter sp.]|nr:4-phosphopantetheinyl transferase superfamily protein [Candidatus Sulfotelmatobacter sp.]
MNQTMNIADPDFQIEEPLTLAEEEVQLWRVDLEAIRDNESRWQEILSPDESTRASRFHFPTDRQRFAAARALLRIILAGYLAENPKHLSFSYSKKEKPSLGPDYAASGMTFNISHSGGVALLAFARRREIGVDVEQVRQDFDVEAIARRFFSAHEREHLAALPDGEKFEAFFRCWTRKEAYIKATGDGLSLPLHQFDVSVAAEDRDALLATRPDASEATLWSLREIPVGPGYAAALCAHGRGWHLKDWSRAQG